MDSSVKSIIAIDIGGTSIKYGSVSTQGEILLEGQTPTEAWRGGKILMDKLIELISKLLMQDKKALGIGISSAGQISPSTGEVLFATDSLPGWTGMKIREILEQKIKLPVFVENDVNAAALGEKWVGAGKGARDFLCVNIGTGIGGAIVINNELVRGTKGLAGEFGHITLVKDGLSCKCGNKGCFEQYASTSALINYVKDIDKKLESKEVNGIMVFNEAKAGNPVCKAAIEYFIDHLALGLGSLVHIFNPPLILIGGGISAQGDELLQAIKKRLGTYVMPYFMDDLEIRFARCGNNAGMLGASYGLLKKIM